MGTYPSRANVASSCGSPVGRLGDDHTGPRPEQDQPQPKRAGRPAAPETEGVIRPLLGADPGWRNSYRGQSFGGERSLISAHR